MVRFIESIKFDPAFAKAVYKAFYDPKLQKLDLYNRSKYKRKFDGWPDGLDMENFEVVSVRGDSIVFVSGGDWQEMIPVSLCLKKDSNKLIWRPFDGYIEDSKDHIKFGLIDLVDLAQKEFNEDCQIAGPMMGDLPQNVGSTLSLGYKNGRILPSPKKRADSKDYDSIPHF
jgi:hypothetical protein